MSNVFGFLRSDGSTATQTNFGAGYVTIDTAQAITGLKTINNDLICNYTLYCNNLDATNNIYGAAVTATTFYPTTVHFPDGSIQTTAYPTTSNNVVVTDTNLASTCYLTFAANGFTGSQALYMDSTTSPLSYIPSTGALTTTRINTTTFYPNSIQFPDATIQTTAYIPSTNVLVTDNNALSTNCYLAFVQSGATSSQALYMDSTTTPLTYIPSTGSLTATRINTSTFFPGTIQFPDATIQTTAYVPSTNLLVTESDSSSTHYLTFVLNPGTSSQGVYIDSQTTPLSYVPSTGKLNAGRYIINGSETIGTNGAGLYQVNAQTVLTNYATSGVTRFYTYDVANAQKNSFSISSLGTTSLVPCNIVTTVASNESSLIVRDSATNNSVNTILNSGGGSFNFIVQAGDNVILSSGPVADAEVLTLTTLSNTTSGVRISPNNVLLGAGGAAGATPSARANFDGALGQVILSGTNYLTFQTGGVTRCQIAPGGVTRFSSNISMDSADPNNRQIELTTLKINDNSAISYGALKATLTASPTLVSLSLEAGTQYVIYYAGFTRFLVNADYSLCTRIDVNPDTGTDKYIYFGNDAVGANAIKSSSTLRYNVTTNTISGNVTGNLTGNVTGTTSLVTLSADTGATARPIVFANQAVGSRDLRTNYVAATSAGLSYIPSSNTLNCGLGGIGTGGINTSFLQIYDNTASSATIFKQNTTNDLIIQNSSISKKVVLVTADASGDTNERLSVNEAAIVCSAQLQTNVGIKGPTQPLSYTNDMIGYSFRSNGNGVDVAMGSGTWYSFLVNPFTFPAPGVYIICFNVQIGASAAAGNILFVNAGLSTTAAILPNVFEITINGVTVSKPAIAGYAAGQGTYCATIPNNTTAYYINVRSQFTGTALTLQRVNSSYQYTRIA